MAVSYVTPQYVPYIIKSIGTKSGIPISRLFLYSPMGGVPTVYGDVRHSVDIILVNGGTADLFQIVLLLYWLNHDNQDVVIEAFIRPLGTSMTF